MTSVSVAAYAGRVNEDFTGTVPHAAVLIDGAGIPGAVGVCRHGVAWYAARLGGALLALLSRTPQGDLAALLAAAIEQVTGEHRDTCDVTDPISPSAAVAVLRRSGGRLEHLVLGDAFVLIDRPGGSPLVVTDPREVVISRRYESLLRDVAADSDGHRRLLRELRAHRNRPGGFWVAKDDPRAAAEAVTGSCPAADAALLSNGAARAVDPLRLLGWQDVLPVLAADGPGEIVRRVRPAEQRSGLSPDDATIAYCTGLF
ncbi:hypothetical protein AB0F81_48235 [Actinoplanes sp. NPDC024001]|uniref:hypothetical protein n=1 Tax=Actinoplanes sp. NPDC024001 TaxID=3154598 RepID=UPI0033C82984